MGSARGVAMRFRRLARTGALLLGAIAFSMWVRDARADETSAPDDEAEAKPEPKTKTVVVAPDDPQGLTVVVPTAGGGKVTAVGCRIVEVDGAKVLVAKNGGPCLLPPFQPAEPKTDPCCCCKKKRRDLHPSDPARSGAVVFSSLTFALGTLVTGAYVTSKPRDSDERRNAIYAYTAVTALVPALPRLVVGDMLGACIFSSVSVASIAFASTMDSAKHSDGMMIFGFLIPQILATVEIATTPYRDDEMKKRNRDTAGALRLIGAGGAPIADAHGTHGAMFSVAAAF